MNSAYEPLDDDDNPDFQTEINNYLIQAGADLNEPGVFMEPAVLAAIKSFDSAHRAIPEWAESFRQVG